jgi:hypothetical protein
MRRGVAWRYAVRVTVHLCRRLDVPHVPIRPDDPERGVEPLLAGDGRVELSLGPLPVLGVQPARPSGIRLLRARARARVERVHLVVPGQALCLEIVVPDTDSRGAAGEGEAFVRRDERDLRLLAIGDVLDRAHEADRPAAGRLDLTHRAHPDRSPFGRDERELEARPVSFACAMAAETTGRDSFE